MGLRCSLLGHDYQSTEVERERDERGDEELITIREYRECHRCGERELVSENKHVRSIPDSETTSDDAVDDEPESDMEQDEPEPTPPMETGQDDAEILEDAPDDTDRETGEWPSSPEETQKEDTEETADWPEIDPDLEDEGFDAEASDGAAPDVDFGGGLVPENSTEKDEGEILSSSSPSADRSSTRSNESEEFAKPSSDRRSEPSPYVAVEYYCPNCGYTAPTGETSLRTGDICPGCRKGYLGEREA